MLIDSHHHLWRYNDREYTWMSGAMSSLRRDFLVPDLEAVMRAAGVDGTIAVQARQTVEETEWLLRLSSRHPVIRGVVGWAPLYAPDAREVVDQLAEHPRLVAVRHVLHDEPDDFFMLREHFNRGVAFLEKHGLAYDILIFERHLPQTIEFVDRHPNQMFVVDHIAKPRIRDAAFSPWKENLEKLAMRENVYCKISGMATESDWSHWSAAQLQPYFDTVLAAFGPQRLMFGSDWPVLTVAGTYRQWVEVFQAWIAGLSAGERESMCSGTATFAYQLQADR